MDGYEAATYGDRIAEIYDELPEVRAQDTEGAVRFLPSASPVSGC